VVEVRRRAKMVFEREGIVVTLLEGVEEEWRKKWEEDLSGGW
jgi:hypothetical protein